MVRANRSAQTILARMPLGSSEFYDDIRALKLNEFKHITMRHVFKGPALVSP